MIMSDQGWGRTSDEGQPSKKLLEVKLPVVNNTVCKKAYLNYKPITDGHICAGGEKGKSGCPVS